MADEAILDAVERAMETKRAEIAALQARLDEAKSELRRYERARGALDPKIGEARVPEPTGFAIQAKELLAEGPMTTAEISHKIGGHRSRAVGAIDALHRAGLVRATGRSRGRSDEFELVEA